MREPCSKPNWKVIAMTDSKPNIMPDGDLEQKLRGAYDLMDPTPEQEAHMLEALLAAQRDQAESAPEPAKDAPAGSDPADAGSAPGANAPGTPQPNRAKIVKPWRIALPLAACLIVGAIAVGAGAFSPMSASAPTANITEQASSSSADVLGDETSTKGEMTTMAQTEAAEVEDEALGLAPDGGLSFNDAGDTGAIAPTQMPDDFNTEEYNAVEERGFVSTKTSPLSTVSADVDTASYCNLRRMINDGHSLDEVPDGAVRIEEMLNYFDYDYPAPTGDDKFSISAQAGACPWNKDTQLLVMGFASAPESAAASKGSNLVFLVDVSGSMDSPDKLELLQDSFATLLENLDGNDRVSIVTYANGEDIVLEGATGDDKAAITRAIYKLRADGSTNGEAGLKQAYEVAQRNFIDGGVNRIIMASDGDLNVGMSSESELYSFVDEQRKTGIYLSVLGFGTGNYKDNKMETLADHGNGSYHYIDCIDEANRVLTKNLAANLVPFADDVKIQVEFNPAQVKGYRLIGYDNRTLANEDFRNDEVDAGDVGPNAQFTVAYEVVLADSPFEIADTELKYGENAPAYDNASGDWLTCTMRYHVFDGDEMREQQKSVDASAVAQDPSADWKFAASVIEFGMTARDSKYAGTSSVESALDLLQGDLPDERRGFRELVEKAARD